VLFSLAASQIIMSREPLNKSTASLRDLKRAGARRSAQAMAVALGKHCNAAPVRFRSRPSGLTGWSTLCVTASRQADACLRNCALIVNQPVSQRRRRLVQRLPSSKEQPAGKRLLQTICFRISLSADVRGSGRLIHFPGSHR